MPAGPFAHGHLAHHRFSFALDFSQASEEGFDFRFVLAEVLRSPFDERLNVAATRGQP